MLIPAYLAGIVAVGFVVACFGLAREGAEGARAVSVWGTGALLTLASLALLFALMLMLGTEKLDMEDESWWNPGQGQQFFAAAGGWLLLAGAGWSLGRRSYLLGATLMIGAAVLFGLWGILLEAGMSGRGPLAFVR